MPRAHLWVLASSTRAMSPASYGSLICFDRRLFTLSACSIWLRTATFLLIFSLLALHSSFSESNSSLGFAAALLLSSSSSVTPFASSCASKNSGLFSGGSRPVPSFSGSVPASCSSSDPPHWSSLPSSASFSRIFLPSSASFSGISLASSASFSGISLPSSASFSGISSPSVSF